MAPHPILSPAFSETVSSQDRGFLYGDGLFETVRCRHGRLLFWQQHRQRLISGCARLAISFDASELDCLGSDLTPHAPSADCILKIIVTRGAGGRGYSPPIPAHPTLILQWHTLPADIIKNACDGIYAVICRHPLSVNPVTAGLKHLNRLDQVMASYELSQVSSLFPEVREGFMLDVDSHLVEGTRSNVFVVINNQLCTPDLTRAGVEGVLRNRLIELFDSMGISVVIRHIHQQEIKQCSEVFVCNSVFGVWPVMKLLEVDSSHKTQTQIEFACTDMARRAQQNLLKDYPLQRG
ncbi:MAG: aminodeoxychorismate lyase [Pseudohongiella sp.]|nr:aminodeoxychorismate lyase [Pseudohongiella sp.]